jgi:hypothetical protein
VIGIRKGGKSVQALNFVARRPAPEKVALSLAVLLGLLSVSHAQQPSGERSQQAASTKGTAAERETWRKALMKTPRPTNGCYTATYPERQWREVPCKTPPTKLFLPRTRGTTQLETVGGSGPDFTATVTGAITQAEGSFDSVTNVTATPAYSLQLNTDFFQTSTCSGSPNTSGCRGWEQFVYHSSSGAGVMQYWLINYGPTGTMCPTPRSTQCDGTHVFTDGWCPITLGTSANPIYCVVNAAAAVPASPEPATSLGQLRVNGAAAGLNGAATDAMTVTVGSTVTAKNGNNYFPDLGSKWGEAEFNVFGDCCNEQAVFNSGASAVPRVEVDSGSDAGPGCLLQSWTAESSNLTLQNTPPSASAGALPALVFGENIPASSGRACRLHRRRQRRRHASDDLQRTALRFPSLWRLPACGSESRVRRPDPPSLGRTDMAERSSQQSRRDAHGQDHHCHLPGAHPAADRRRATRSG